MPKYLAWLLSVQMTHRWISWSVICGYSEFAWETYYLQPATQYDIFGTPSAQAVVILRRQVCASILNHLWDSDQLLQVNLSYSRWHGVLLFVWQLLALCTQLSAEIWVLWLETVSYCVRFLALASHLGHLYALLLADPSGPGRPFTPLGTPWTALTLVGPDLWNASVLTLLKHIAFAYHQQRLLLCALLCYEAQADLYDDFTHKSHGVQCTALHAVIHMHIPFFTVLVCTVLPALAVCASLMERYTPDNPEPKRSWDQRPVLPRRRPPQAPASSSTGDEQAARQPLPRLRRRAPLPRLKTSLKKSSILRLRKLQARLRKAGGRREPLPRLRGGHGLPQELQDSMKDVPVGSHLVELDIQGLRLWDISSLSVPADQPMDTDDEVEGDAHQGLYGHISRSDKSLLPFV